MVLRTALPHLSRVARRDRTAPPHGGRSTVAVLVAGSLVLVGGCGGGDDADDQPDTAAASGDDPADASGESEDVADASDPETEGGDDTTFDPSTVASCLADAGFETSASSDLLSEQQRADQLSMFGQIDSLTFDAASSGFAGGVSFFETAAQASERAEQLADVAEVERVIGTALISIEAGTGYEEAVAAAEVCLAG